mmetsp:Transcript_7715/g.8282  ORF Transcript_7715/g.8282 Transcript_7715/m.8282 type:complete len:123 (+) Transcript_7715:505-873(+)
MEQECKIKTEYEMEVSRIFARSGRQRDTTSTTIYPSNGQAAYVTGSVDEYLAMDETFVPPPLSTVRLYDYIYIYIYINIYTYQCQERHMTLSICMTTAVGNNERQRASINNRLPPKIVVVVE